MVLAGCHRYGYHGCGSTLENGKPVFTAGTVADSALTRAGVGELVVFFADNADGKPVKYFVVVAQRTSRSAAGEGVRPASLKTPPGDIPIRAVSIAYREWKGVITIRRGFADTLRLRQGLLSVCYEETGR
jgi:hypothetical protein